MAAAAQALAPTITQVTGQFCTNLSRILVPRAKQSEFVAAMAEALRAIKVGDPYDPETYMGPDRRSPAPRQGRALHQAGPGRRRDPRRRRRPARGPRPRLLRRADACSPTSTTASVIAQEEIFGPVACVIAYDTLDHAIAIANDTIYGLAGSVFTNDAAAAYHGRAQHPHRHLRAERPEVRLLDRLRRVQAVGPRARGRQRRHPALSRDEDGHPRRRAGTDRRRAVAGGARRHDGGRSRRGLRRRA